MSSRHRLQWPAELLLLSSLALAACTRCGSSPASVVPPDAGVQISREWLEGIALRDTSAPVAGGTLRIRAMSEPAGLNFLDDRSHDGWTSRITRNLITESLLEIDRDTSQLKPQLAARYVESEDHTAVTFILRQGVAFHDNAPFTADDVIATLDAVMNLKQPTGAIRGDFADLISWQAVDPQTVELRWKRASPLTLRAIAKLPIYSARQLRGDWAELSARPVGTGPYQLDTWDRGTRLTLKKAEHWWGGTVWLSALQFLFVKDHSVASAAFAQGQYDLMTSIQPAFWRAMEAVTPANQLLQTRFQRLRGLDNSYSFIGWNQQHPILQDVSIRKAISLMYPEAAITAAVDLSLESPTTCPFFLNGASCDHSLRHAPIDLQGAKKLLETAGYTDSNGDGVVEKNAVPARFTLLIPAASVRLGKLAPLLQEQLKLVGIDMQIEKVDAATLNSRVSAREFDAVSRVWTEFDTEQDLFANFHSSQIASGSNFVGMNDHETDALLDQIHTTWDASARHALEKKLHQRLFDLQPYLILSARQTLDAADVTVHNLTPSVLWYDLRTVWKR